MHTRATPVTVLTGHLGSGKTTLLQHVLEDPALQRTALIINEFGEVSIDHLIVARHAENMVQLLGGCICCAVRVDFAMTLRELYEKRALGEIPPFDNVIIETSGLADPVPIIHTLMANPLMHKHFVPDAVVTCVDQVNYESTVAEDQIAMSQVQLADVVVLTKGDLATREQRERTLTLVRAANDRAELIQAMQGHVDAGEIFLRGLFEATRAPGDLQGWLLGGASEGHAHGDRGDGAHHHHDPHSTSHVIRTEQKVDMAGLGVFLNWATNSMRQRLLRIKGVVDVKSRPHNVQAEGPLVVHGVRDKFYPLEWMQAWPDADHSTRLVFIGRDLDGALLDRRFEELCL